MKKLLIMFSVLSFMLNFATSSISKDKDTDVTQLLLKAIIIKENAIKLGGSEMKNQLNKAIDAFNKVCKVNDTNHIGCTKAKLHIASIFDILGEEEKALEIYYKILRYNEHLDEVAVNTHKMVGIIYIKQEKFSKAIEQFKYILKNYPDQEETINEANEMIKLIKNSYLLTE